MKKAKKAAKKAAKSAAKKIAAKKTAAKKSAKKVAAKKTAAKTVAKKAPPAATPAPRGWEAPAFQTPGVENEDAFAAYLRVKKKHNEPRAARFAGYLNNIARLINARLTPDMVKTTAGIFRIMHAVTAAANEAAAKGGGDKYTALTPKLINKHRTALFHYCRAANKTNPV